MADFHFFKRDFVYEYSQKTRCVCETQMPPIIANSKDGQDNNDIYFDTSRQILSQEMTMCIMEALNLYFRSYDQCQFLKKMIKCLGQKVKYQQKDVIIGNTHVNLSKL